MDYKQGQLKGFKSGQTEIKSGQILQIRAREISNWGKRDFKPRQGLQIGAQNKYHYQWQYFNTTYTWKFEKV